MAEIEDDAAACYLRARGAMARHVRFSRQVAEADERVLRIRYPDWDQAESGQDWLRTWVKGGWATESGALLLPATVADVAGAAGRWEGNLGAARVDRPAPWAVSYRGREL